MTVVVKLGGRAARDVAAIQRLSREHRVVVVHGGGPRITAALSTAGIESAFVGGLRVTTAAAVAVVRDALATVNGEVVGLLGDAVGVMGEDVFTAEPLDPALGYVGDVVAVDPTGLRPDRIPVVTPIALGTDGALYNVNADTAAAALAVALGADEAVFLTDVPGLYVGDAVVPRIGAADVESLLPTLANGIVPKLGACLRAVRGGVPRVRVTDALDATGTVVTC